jgi:uncharacterized protein
VTKIIACLAFAALLVPGCTFLEADPDESRYFVLSSTPATPAPSRGRSDIHFGLGPVKLPGYLDTQNLVLAGGGGSVQYVPDAFWAESLEDAFTRALLYRTGARIGTAHAVAFPWYSTTRVDYKVPVDVLRFEATSDGRAVLDARWSVEDVTHARVLYSTESVFEESAGSEATGSQPEKIVDALSRCIDRLAEAIAVAVTAAPPRSASPARAPRSSSR